MSKRLISTVVATAVALVIAVFSGLALVACSGAGQAKAGLDVAYEKLCAVNGLGGEDAFAYEEETDALIVDMEKVSDIDKFFEVLGQSVSGADIGALCLHNVVEVDADKLSQGLADLPCNSLECLDMGGSQDDGLADALRSNEEWTALLTKTGALYDPDAYTLANYSADARPNVESVKSIWIDASGPMNGHNGLYALKGVEEIRYIEGITSEYRENNEKWGFHIGDSKRLFDNLEDLTSLERVIVYPDTDGWTAGDNYCKFMLELQLFDRSFKTNEPCKSWDGDESSLVNVADIDILSLNDSDEVVKELKNLLEDRAEQAFEKGKSFTVVDTAPKLDGTCVVYLGDPHDSQFGDYDKFFDLTSISLFEELEGTGVKTMRNASDKFDYFVYVYPTYNLVGTYGGVTEAYDTEVNVRIYDMNKQEKYESGVITTVPAPSEYRYSGTPDSRYWPNIDKEAAISYIASLT
ncbi:MAG: hypothetical protein J5818_05510 [Eggerthellaceae bacterium]|nr:hypothetical protein [Eggerthellaceae bacterium]